MGDLIVLQGLHLCIFGDKGVSCKSDGPRSTCSSPNITQPDIASSELPLLRFLVDRLERRLR
jgi:hypothetical protein